MKAVLLRHFSDPAQLQIAEVPEPEPGPGEALIQVAAAGINPSDVKNVQGGMAATTLPRIPGRDFAGTVVSGPRDWIGRKVWGTGGDIGFIRNGSHAEFMLIPAEALVEMPSELSNEAAGSAGLAFVTAWLALVSSASITSADTVLILGAAGGVGSAAVQIARLFGAHVIAGVRNSEQAEQISRLHPAAVLQTGDRHFADRVRGYARQGATVVFDASGHLFAEAVESAAHGARVCVISAPPDGKVTFNLRSLYRKELHVMGNDTRGLDVTACANLLTQMNPKFESGKFRADVPQVFPLEEAGAAYRKRMEGPGLCCLRPRSQR